MPSQTRLGICFSKASPLRIRIYSASVSTAHRIATSPFQQFFEGGDLLEPVDGTPTFRARQAGVQLSHRLVNASLKRGRSGATEILGGSEDPGAHDLGT